MTENSNIGEMNIPELVDLLHKVADEIQLREMQNADRCVCCGAIVPEGRQVCPQCERG